MLTVEDLLHAASWTRCVDETHQVQRLANQLHGPTPIRPRTDEQKRRALIDTICQNRRRRFENAGRGEENAARARAEADERARIQAARRREAQVARAYDKRREGRYLMPHERALLGT